MTARLKIKKEKEVAAPGMPRFKFESANKRYLDKVAKVPPGPQIAEGIIRRYFHH